MSDSLSEEQRRMIQAKKQLALERRKRCQENKEKSQDLTEPKKKKLTDVLDTGAGFFLDEEDDDLDLERVITHEQAPLLDPSALVCGECSKEFIDSYLLKHFSAKVCDSCKEENEKFDLITKTDARNQYLLKDADFDKRGEPLRFISRKNPHQKSWGEMKLFLKCQVEKRCLEVWESMDKLEEEKEKREKAREATKQKKFDKRVMDLRMAVRSSLWTKDLRAHEHVFGEESYDSDEDEYSKTCAECGHVMTYEKM